MKDERPEKRMFTTRDQVEHNHCSRAWILYCLDHGTFPQPDAHTGRNGKVAVWFKLHEIPKSRKRIKERINEKVTI